MMQVWLLFKIIETIIGSICMVYHAVGFSHNEPLPHIMLFCGTFFGFALLSLVGAIGISVGIAPPSVLECIMNFTAAFMYFASSIISMQHAEDDFHLMYLSDFEEPLHQFFANCRAQSIGALAAGAVHLLHTILAFDVLFINVPVDEIDDVYASTETLLIRPLRLYFLGMEVQNRLRKFTWFDNLCTRADTRVAIYSPFRKYRDSKLMHFVSAGSSATAISISSRKAKMQFLKDRFPDPDTSSASTEEGNVLSMADLQKQNSKDSLSTTLKLSRKPEKLDYAEVNEKLQLPEKNEDKEMPETSKKVEPVLKDTQQADTNAPTKIFDVRKSLDDNRPLSSETTTSGYKDLNNPSSDEMSIYGTPLGSKHDIEEIQEDSKTNSKNEKPKPKPPPS